MRTAEEYRVLAGRVEREETSLGFHWRDAEAITAALREAAEMREILDAWIIAQHSSEITKAYQRACAILGGEPHD